MNNDNRRRAKTTLLSHIDSDEFYHGEKHSCDRDQELSSPAVNNPGVLPIEVPFEYRHCCWFCKEPAGRVFNHKPESNADSNTNSEGMAIPTCHECATLAAKHRKLAIAKVREKVKSGLRKIYRKDLAIGVNWTKEELENSGFEGGNFEGFARSAWFMFEIARDRVNFKGWPLQVSGCEVSLDEQVSFHFDGTDFTDVSEAIEFYSKTYRLDSVFLSKSVYSLTPERFGDALRLARICEDFSASEKNEALSRLIESLGNANAIGE
ncbi:hypothetical protein [Thalassotalea sp. PS06]|uniref:hypothetical protein n=1 Tax=Thalassotalea sp. PS06 TaxID=2594005 RepID=UPI001164C33C|nr:hypothetical protein [Thalassotalea sp. PS06]QDP01870.1 hypothetical protein FNC98_11270 [Thalassotalea sp. PS06]